MAHELTEKDGMFSVGSVPWHGLGKVLDNPPSIDEALRNAELDWTVSTYPLYADVSGVLIDAPAQAVFRDDTQDLLGVVGPHYTPLQNEEAFSVFQPLVESGGLALETAGSLRGGRKVWILARILEEADAEIADGDQVCPYVLLSNSHDGSTAVRFGVTPIRVVCHNTLSAAHSDEHSKLIRIIHHRHVLRDVRMLRDVLDLSRRSFRASVEEYRRLERTGISDQDLARYVQIVVRGRKKAEAEDEVQVLKTTERKIIHLFHHGCGSARTGKNWWRAYNAVNEFLIHQRGRTADSRLSSLWFGDAGAMDRRALDTALKMAA